MPRLGNSLSYTLLLTLGFGSACAGDDASDSGNDTDASNTTSGGTADDTAGDTPDDTADDAPDDTAGTGAGVEHDLGQLQMVLETNADIAFAAYSDSVTTAQALSDAIDALVADPTQANLDAARDAWLVSREPYGQTEVYRFRASPIDDTNYDAGDGEDGPEGDINAWPLGEGLIDYVVTGTDFGDDQVNVTDHNTGVVDPIPDNNIINSTDITIDAALLANAATAEDEHDVIAGYHAIEFLLWGQDLNGDGSADTIDSRDGTPGNRPVTDFALDDTCTSGPTVNGAPDLCQRRGQYLQVAAAKLIADLTAVRDEWASGATYRTAFTDVADVDAAKGKLLEILVGMGTLSEGELGGERMQIALSANSQEDEHSCFSDNTHRDIWLNAEGVANSYYGEYAGYDSTLDGSDDQTGMAVSGYGIDDYLTDLGLTDLEGAVAGALSTTETNYTAIDAAARGGAPVDVQILDASADAAAAMRDTVVSLNAQSTQIANIAVDLDVGTPDDVVDPDASECDTTDPTTEC
ncbi:MAG: imelysin family protein [Myxococcota bacterium]